MNITDNFSTKFNTKEPLFLVDDTSRNASLIVTKILAFTDKHLFVEAIYINPDYREEPQELLINLKGNVIAGEELLFYFASNNLDYFKREFSDSEGAVNEPFAPEIAFLHQPAA